MILNSNPADAGSQSLKEVIETRLNAAFSPSVLQVLDESSQHAGHKAAELGGRHFAIEIASFNFQGKTRVDVHREIYALFADLMPHPLHALKIKIID